MKTSRRTVVVSCSALVAVGLFCSCQKQTPLSPEVLARVGDTVITKDEFRAELERRAKNGQSVGSPAEREAVLDELIRQEALFATAKAAGHDRDPELEQRFKRMVAAKFEDDQWKKQPTVPKPEPGEVDLYYRSHPDQFTSPEKVHVAVIYLRVSGKAEAEKVAEAQQRAEEVRRQALAKAAEQEHFGLLAQENSDDQATRYRGGDCGYLTRDSAKVRWEHTVREAAFALNQKGEISPVLRSADGFYLLKLIDRQAARTAPLAEVRERIEKQLLASAQKQARALFNAELRRGVSIQVNQPLLQTMGGPVAPVRTSNAVPPTLPTP